jgi:hypothetical protein
MRKRALKLANLMTMLSLQLKDAFATGASMILTDYAVKWLIVILLVAFIISVNFITNRYIKMSEKINQHNFLEKCWTRHGNEYCKYTDSDDLSYCTKEINHKIEEIPCE